MRKSFRNKSPWHKKLYPACLLLFIRRFWHLSPLPRYFEHGDGRSAAPQKVWFIP